MIRLELAKLIFILSTVPGRTSFYQMKKRLRLAFGLFMKAQVEIKLEISFIFPVFLTL